jgi:hypothetical protein
MKWKNPVCDSPGCPGFFVNSESLAVERCDTCKIFESDDAAAAAADALTRLGLRALARRPRHELDFAATLAPLVKALTCNAPEEKPQPETRGDGA